MERDEALQQLRRLISAQRWAALATVDPGGHPRASMVAYVPEADFSGVLLHLSRLAAHTSYLLETPQVSLAISEADNGQGDPQTLARVSISGFIHPIAPDSEAYAAGKRHYLARLPDAEQRFGFGDFMLLRLQPQVLRFVGGFGRAFSFSGSDLALPGED